MKRKGITILCIVMLVCQAVGALAATSFTLPEKMSRQLEIGSGLKGAFTLQGEGLTEALQFLTPLLGKELQVRSMVNGEELHAYVYQDSGNEKQLGLTEVYRKDNTWTFRSDLVPDVQLYLPPVEESLDQLSRKEGGNPSMLSALWRLLHVSAGDYETKWAPAVQTYLDALEGWLAQYASAPVVQKAESGSSLMEMTYEIPVKDLIARIVQWDETAAADAALGELLSGILTEEQKEVYLNPHLGYFYQEALEQLKLDFDLTISRTVSTMGEPVSLTIELPLDEEIFKYSSLTLVNENQETICTLQKEEESLTLVIPEGFGAEGNFTGDCWLIRRMKEEGQKSLSLRLDLHKTVEESTDEETRSHEMDHYVLRIDNDFSRLTEGEKQEDFEAIEPIDAAVDLHYFSKYPQNSPTTLEIQAGITQGAFRLSLEGSFKTASPWIFSPFTIKNPVNALELAPEVLGGYGEKLIENAEATLIVPTPTPEPTATPEPTPTVTPEPTPETMATPELTSAPEGETEQAEDIDAEKADSQEPKEESSDEPTEEPGTDTEPADAQNAPAEETEPADAQNAPAEEETNQETAGAA